MQQVVSRGENGAWKIRPHISTTQLKILIEECFGLIINTDEINEPVAYMCRNFLVKGHFKDSNRINVEDKLFVIKIYNSFFNKRLQWYHQIFDKIEQISSDCHQQFKLPIARCDLKYDKKICFYPIQLKEDALFLDSSLQELSCYQLCETLQEQTYVKHLVRLNEYIPGNTINNTELNEKLALSYGKSVAVLSQIMQKWEEPLSENPEDHWNVLSASTQLRHPFLASFKDKSMAQSFSQVLDEFDNDVQPLLNSLAKQWIHGDLSNHNIIQKDDEVVGIIDFDMTVYSYRVIDISTTLMYVTASSSTDMCIFNVQNIYRGYRSVIQLNEIELEVLYNLILVRFVQSLTIGQYKYEFEDPDNKYLLETTKHGMDAFKYIRRLGKEKFMELIHQMDI